MNYASRIAWGFIGVAILLAFASTQLPISFQSSTPFAGHIFLVVAIIQSVLQIGSAVLFVSGLPAFKREFKHAYFLIVAGIVLLGLGRLQFPVLQMVDLWLTDWVLYGGIEIIFIISLFLILLGIRSFALLIQFHTRLLSWPLFFCVVLIASIFIIFIPHSVGAMLGESEFAFDSFSVLSAVELLCGMWASILVFKLKQNSSPVYTNALAWFFIALVFCVISIVQTVVFHFIGFENIYVRSGLLMLPYMLSGALFLKAGQAFTTISKY